jgi:hypothetical protein
MPDEVAADHSSILATLCEDKPPTYNDVSDLLLAQLGLEMPAVNVKLLGDILVGARRNEAKRPSRSDLTERITELRDAAHEISDALASPSILSWLAEARPDLYEKWPDHWAATQDLAQTAEAALLLVPKGKGRARSTTPREISPRATCALFVIEMFELSGKKTPSTDECQSPCDRRGIVAGFWWTALDWPREKSSQLATIFCREHGGISRAPPGSTRVCKEAPLGTELSVKQAYSVPYVPSWQWEYRYAA